MQDKYAVLKQVFGYAQFRGGQEALIDASCAGQDVLGVMPTGAGKSLCFQVPALMLPGITLVISPLISLMRDQVSALCQAGVPAAYLNSSLTQGQYSKALRNAYDGQYKIIYIAPERLLADDLLAFAQQAAISLLVVDEAHCVSQWGHDFRPSYLDIPRFLQQLQAQVPVAAFTATATEQVRSDIRRLLGLRSPLELVTGFDRPNLFFEVKILESRAREAALLRLLETHRGKSGIIYCATRATVEKVCDTLCAQGLPATRYHAGLGVPERRNNQEAFARDEKPIMVATNAFGMGIDKSNVSYVIHYNMPKDVESYYQEAGRAGRDGMPARCTLLFCSQDIITHRYLIQEGGDPGLRDAHTVEHALERLDQMANYCTQRHCLRAYLLRYFGETTDDTCDACSACAQERSSQDVTGEARSIFAFIRDSRGYLSPGTLAQVLAGKRNERTRGKQYIHYQSFGAMRGVPMAKIMRFIDLLMEEGYIAHDSEPYHRVRLLPPAQDVLEGAHCQLNLSSEEAPFESPEASPAPVRRSHSRDAKKTRLPAEPAGEDAPISEPLFERLSALRMTIAQEQKVPAFVVFSNAALYDMCRRLPRKSSEFLQVSGVGQHKLMLYGDRFMDAIADYLDSSH